MFQSETLVNPLGIYLGAKTEIHYLTAEEKAQAVAMYVAGESQDNVAKRFNVASDISFIFSKEDIKNHITSSQKELTFRCLNPVIDNILSFFEQVHWLVLTMI